MAEAVKTEPGTLLFWPHRSSTNDRVFFLYELFADDAAFAAHQQTDAFKTLVVGHALPKLARRAAMSTRTLCRRFHEQVGDTPAAWIARARVARAQHLLETTQWSVDDVALKVGFRSSTVLRDQFSRVLGTTPRTYRQSFSRS